MNNYYIKKLRSTMLSIVAVVLVSIGFMACSNDTFMTQNSKASAGSYQVCIPANIGGGGTRAIAYNSETDNYDAIFETTDEISVYNATKEKWVWGRLNPDKVGNNAILVGRLEFEFTPDVEDELILYYKNDGFSYSRDFTYDDIADFALAKVKITAINDGNITTSEANFENLQSVYKINFTGIASDVKIKKVTIESKQRKLVRYYNPWNIEWPNEFGPVTYKYKDEGTDQHELIFLLRFANNSDNSESASGDEISFMALGSDGHIYSGSKVVSKDLENSKYYDAEIEMSDLGLALTLTNDATGEPVEFNDWINIFSNNAAYTLKGTGYNNGISWYGSDDPKNTLTLNGVTINNDNTFFYIFSGDSENTKEHYLVLDDENVVNFPENGTTPITVENSNLHISAASTGGKLTINFIYQNIGVINNSKLMLESGEITLNGNLGIDEGSYFLITNSGKLRIKQDYVDTRVKAGNGYVLQTAKEGDYTVYTVTAAPPYEDPIALSAATTADIGKIVGSDGNVHVLYWALPEGVSPVGMLASVSSTGHGLAIAKNIQVKKSYEWGGYDINEYFSWGDSYWGNDGKTATEIFNDWAAENSVGFGEWRIPTKADCQNMILSCRIAGDATEPSDSHMVANGFKSKLTEAGIYRDNYLFCWTGTQVDDEWMATMELYNNSDEGASIANFYSTMITGDNTASINPVLEF